MSRPKNPSIAELSGEQPFFDMGRVIPYLLYLSISRAIGDGSYGVRIVFDGWIYVYVDADAKNRPIGNLPQWDDLPSDLEAAFRSRFIADGGRNELQNSTKQESAFDNSAKTVAVSGGTFSSAVSVDLCAEGCAPVNNGDDTYGVVAGVAQIGTKRTRACRLPLTRLKTARPSSC